MAEQHDREEPYYKYCLKWKGEICMVRICMYNPIVRTYYG